MSASSVVLELADVVKTFPGVRALRGVNFSVRAGEVHALVGENGAGKSTLMGVAAGSIAPDAGTVEIGGHRLGESSPALAQGLGLAVVYQHPAVLEDLTVLENLFLAMPAARRPSISAAEAWCRERLAVVALAVDPQARVSELSTAEVQLLEIAKALAVEARVLVLDEPTESLSPAESERLFSQVRTITARGAAVVYISHRLPEVKRLADRLTVLRDGETRGTFAADAVSEDEILALIVGREVSHAFPPKGEPASLGDPVVLETRALSGGRFAEVSMSVRAGEIVGLAGVEGNGQREFLRALAGLATVSAGSVSVTGHPVDTRSPGAAQRAGIVHMPGDRHREGLLLTMSVRENVSLLTLGSVSRRGWLQRRRETAAAADEVRRLGVVTPSVETPVASLSGGNQQKVLFARSLRAAPRVLLADEPTRGVDAAARMQLYRVLREAATAGMAVVVLSSDAIELQGLCDRVQVFSRGRIVRTLEGDEITESNITGAAITSVAQEQATEGGALTRLRLRRFAAGDYMPSLVVAALILALGAYTSASNGFFLNHFNLTGMLLLASALAFVALGQLMVMLVGGIDLSVGPMTGLSVVLFSFFAATGKSDAMLVLGVVVVVGAALVVGLCNGLLIRVVRLAPVVATLATYIVLQGISLLLRPQPGGELRLDVTSAIKTSLGPVPVAFIAVAVLALVCEVLLRRTHAGIELRAVGSSAPRAHQLGARVNRTHLLAYLLCALFSALGGLMLASQVGIGDPSVGVNYTLTSIAAVVLGGASIFGGRGSFIGALLGASLIQEITSATTFLNLTVAWQYWLPGVLILAGAAVYSRVRAMPVAGPALRRNARATS